MTADGISRAAILGVLGALFSGVSCGGDGTTNPPPPPPGFEPSCAVLNPDPSWTFTRLGIGTKPALAVDPTGTAHVAYMAEDLDGWIRIAELPAGSTDPTAPETLAQGYFYGPIGLALGDGGERAVAYHDHDLEDQVLARFSQAWTLQPMTNPGHDGWYNSVQFDETGRVHTATFDPRGFNGEGVNYGVWDGLGWSIELASPGSFDYAGGTSIAVAASGRVYIAYFDDLAGVARIATRASPQNWATTEVEPLGSFDEVGRFPSMRLDPDGSTLHLVYLARTGPSTGVIRYAYGTPGTLTTRDVIPVTDFDIGFSGARDIATLDLKSDGTPIVSIQTRQNLQVIELRPTGDFEVVSFFATPGVQFRQQTSTAIGPNDRVHVAYWQTGEEDPGTVCLMSSP